MSELLTERIGSHIDDGDCRDILARLVKHEDGNGTGRVRLQQFYASNVLDGNWQFRERTEYLRLMGVLDESDSSEPRVIIPNYLYSHTNCLNVSRFYNLCCMNQCDGLLAHLEDRIQAPQSTPEEIISIVSALPSASVPAGRTLSQALRRKLQEVAEHHNGWIPLHGRLFSQWMHFAYPRECPYPHTSGATLFLSESEWQQQTGNASSLSQVELQSYADSVQSGPELGANSSKDLEQTVTSRDGLCSAMWTHEEELVDDLNWSPTIASGGRRLPSAVFRPFMLALLLASFAVTLRSIAWQGAVSLGVGIKSIAACKMSEFAVADGWRRRTTISMIV